MSGFRVSVRLAALAAGLVIGQAAALAADAARGKILFTEKYGCYQCHGTQGQGSPATGAERGSGRHLRLSAVDQAGTRLQVDPDAE
jgi:cytochrome c